MFQVSSKATIYKWRKSRGFPDPVTMMPLRWLRSAVEEWRRYWWLWAVVNGKHWPLMWSGHWTLYSP